MKLLEMHIETSGKLDVSFFCLASQNQKQLQDASGRQYGSPGCFPMS